MAADLVAGVALSGLVLLLGRGSASRLRPAAAWRPSLPAFSLSRPPVSSAAIDVPSALALELRSGRDLAAALTAVADEHPPLGDRLRRAGVAARSGGLVGPALVGDADSLGRSLLATGACCDASTATGLPLAELLDTVAEAARGRAVLVGRAKAELAGARSTTVVLACLPAVGLAMGHLLGARPLHILLGTVWGAGCLVAALLLTVVGLAWSRAIRVGVVRGLP